MADINSPLGRRQFAMQNPQQRKVFTVPDETGMSAESTTFDDDMPPREAFTGPSYGEMDNAPPVVKRVRQMAAEPQINREELQRVRQEVKQSKLEVPPKAKNRIELLLGLKRKFKEVTVEGVKFTLKSLKHAEYQDVFSAISRLSDVSNIVVSLELQIQTLARAITHIDDIPVLTVLSVSSVEEVVDYLREFESDVIDQLNEEFKSLKSETEVKKEEESEVSENLKK
jgi:hypothetical protein